MPALNISRVMEIQERIVIPKTPIIPGSKKDFSKIELPPFKSAVKHGVKMVMTGQ
ncbi:MAG: hypothetical protein CM1200mP10_32640 [Candidatus Neomarinimicrobiota bacterium]|nr:MAG: hypothetical protein CM1200mP10_32640 [Candidatus Neomarinimicrobiota bacterium]